MLLPFHTLGFRQPCILYLRIVSVDYSVSTLNSYIHFSSDISIAMTDAHYLLASPINNACTRQPALAKFLIIVDRKWFSFSAAEFCELLQGGEVSSSSLFCRMAETLLVRLQLRNYDGQTTSVTSFFSFYNVHSRPLFLGTISSEKSQSRFLLQKLQSQLLKEITKVELSTAFGAKPCALICQPHSSYYYTSTISANFVAWSLVL